LVLKSDIEEEVYFRYRKAQQEVLHTDRLNCIHVSDLIKPCNRNVIYSKIWPEEWRSTNSESQKSLFFGQLLHKAIQLDKRNEVPLLWNYINDKAFDLKTTLKSELAGLEEHPWYYISGSIDDIVQVKDEDVLVDMKTTGSIDYFKSVYSGRFKKNEGHVAQLNMYRVLYNKVFNKDIKWGVNIYIDNCVSKETKEKPIVIPFKLEKLEITEPIMKERAGKIHDFMTKGVLPGRTKNYLCDGMCDYATKCFQDNRNKFTDSL